MNMWQELYSYVFEGKHSIFPVLYARYIPIES